MAGFCDCDEGCFVIWKRKVVVGLLFCFIFLGSVVVATMVEQQWRWLWLIAIDFCGGCFFILLF